MQIAVHRFRKIINFGHVKSVENDNTGDYDETFVSDFSLHFAFYQRSQTQNYQLLNTDLENTIVIAVRSRNGVDKTFQAQFKNDDRVFSIADISQDATDLPVGYDLVTLKFSKKVK